MPHTDVIPTSASTASTGKGIRYVGNHCYGYSGEYGANTTPVTAFDFTTGAGYIVGKFEIQIALENNGASNTVSMTNIKFNTLLVANMVGGYKGVDGVPWGQVTVIIPPLTRVEANLFSDENQSSRLMTMTFSGRVYGAK